jgi:hypothetical protein
MRDYAHLPGTGPGALVKRPRPRPSHVIDFDQIGDLAAALGDCKVKTLLELACIELARRPPAMRRLADGGDVALLRAEAHGFKGAVASIGLISVARRAQAVELALPGADLHHSLDRLESEAIRTLTTVRSFLAQGSFRGLAAGD